jgi:hypothetical protein
MVLPPRRRSPRRRADPRHGNRRPATAAPRAMHVGTATPNARRAGGRLRAAAAPIRRPYRTVSRRSQRPDFGPCLRAPKRRPPVDRRGGATIGAALVGAQDAYMVKRSARTQRFGSHRRCGQGIRQPSPHPRYQAAHILPHTMNGRLEEVSDAARWPRRSRSHRDQDARTARRHRAGPSSCSRVHINSDRKPGYRPTGSPSSTGASPTSSPWAKRPTW